MHPDDFMTAAGGPATSRGIQIRWLGTAGFELRAEGTTLLIDPYLTRVGLGAYLRGPIRPDTERLARELPRADAIVVGHSHFDHVMDVPDIALRTGARVIGSRSTANLMAAAGLPPEQIVTCEGGEVFDVGPFKVTLTPSEHSRFALGGRVPYAGDIPCSCELPLRGSGYKCGQVFAIAVELDDLCVYHMGSANLIDDAIVHKGVDVFLMGISGRHATERYIPRVLRRLEPRLVLPMHYDNFFRAAERPMTLLPLTRFGRFVDDVTGFDRDIGIRTLAIGGSLAL
ncbi:MAG: MBL fold metallo-hydrolase [Deltaproteobacteria bacterium]|nr:MBL fold metallo-hydrolase [Deltaproteobacteria bacterium]